MTTPALEAAKAEYTAALTEYRALIAEWFAAKGTRAASKLKRRVYQYSLGRAQINFITGACAAGMSRRDAFELLETLTHGAP